MAKIVPPFLRSFGNYDADAVSQETGLRCEDVSRTKQSFKDECDINVIIDRFGVGYDLPEGGIPADAFGEWSDSMDYHSNMNSIAKAHEAFDAFPADVRSRFNNDPGQLLDFLRVDSNRDEAVKLGLVFPKAPVEPPKADSPPSTPVSS